MANIIPSLRLNNGVEMPALGFGTFAKEGISGKIFEAVGAALDAGYRHLDCAWYYENEDEVGAALRAWLLANPSYQRSDIFITTKVWPHLMEPEDVEWSLTSSLDKLGLDYVDSFLIHWPFACERTDDRRVKLGTNGKYIINEALTKDLSPVWRTMERLQTLGKARSIGVSNFTIKHLTELLSHAVIPPTVNQVEIHPFLPNTRLIDFCRAHSVLPVAYSPLGSQHQCPTTGERVLENEELKGLAESKGVDVAQICISWGLQRGTGVLPKSASKNRIATNIAVVTLSPAEMEQVDGIAGKVVGGVGKRFVDLQATFGIEVFAAAAADEV